MIALDQRLADDQRHLDRPHRLGRRQAASSGSRSRSTTALALGLVLFYVFEFMPLGRRLLFVGRGRSVARLSGIRVSRLRWGALSSSGVISAFAGVLYAGTLGVGRPDLGPQLPAARVRGGLPRRDDDHPRALQPARLDRGGLLPRHRHHRPAAPRRADLRAAAVLRRRAGRRRRALAGRAPPRRAADRLIEIDPAAVEDAILSLARHGAHGETGVWRAAFSPEWSARAGAGRGVAGVAGLEVRRDAVGNVWGRLEGTRAGRRDRHRLARRLADAGRPLRRRARDRSGDRGRAGAEGAGRPAAAHARGRLALRGGGHRASPPRASGARARSPARRGASTSTRCATTTASRSARRWRRCRLQIGSIQRRAAGRDVAGGERRKGQHGPKRDHDAGVDCRGAEQAPLDHASQQNRERNPERDAERRRAARCVEPVSFSDVRPRRAEGDPHANLVGALRDHVGHDAVDTAGRVHQGDCSEHAHHRGDVLQPQRALRGRGAQRHHVIKTG